MNPSHYKQDGSFAKLAKILESKMLQLKLVLTCMEQCRSKKLNNYVPVPVPVGFLAVYNRIELGYRIKSHSLNIPKYPNTTEN
jgi:hypothetical protein